MMVNVDKKYESKRRQHDSVQLGEFSLDCNTFSRWRYSCKGWQDYDSADINAAL